MMGRIIYPIYWLVVSTPLKNICKWEGLFHILINLGFDLMDAGQVFVSHNLPGPGLPLYKIQCVPTDCRYKMQNQVKFCHYKMQIYPT